MTGEQTANPVYTEAEVQELFGYLTAQMRARDAKDEVKYRVAGAAVVSFRAEHGEAKTLAITEELDRRFGRVMNKRNLS